MQKHLATITPILTATVFFHASLSGAPATYKKQLAAAPKSSPTPTNAPPPPCIDENLCRAELRYRDPRGVGYNTGYTTLELFLTPNWNSNIQPFVDLRGHIFNDGKWAANAGLGARGAWLKDVIFGLNTYYDFRDAHGISPNQVGVGIEGLSEWADIRINGSYPFSSKTAVSCAEFSGFCGNSALAEQEIKAALPRIYGEIGAPVGWAFREVDLYVALGSYYLFSRSIEGATLGDAWGGKARICLKPYDAIRLEGEITWDHIYGTRPQGAITVSLPLGPSNRRTKGASFTRNYAGRCHDPALRLARLTQPVYRDEIIPVQDKDYVFAINDNCCPSPKILFVDNSMCTKGCGTFESPYADLNDALAKAKSGDVVYLFPGTGSPIGLDQGYTLPNGARLIGSATDFTLCCYTIPACTPCEYPVLSINSAIAATAALTLGENNEVAGIEISGAELAIDMGSAKNVFIRDSIFINNGISIGNLPGIEMAAGKKQILTNQFYTSSTAEISLLASSAYQANIQGNIFSGGPGAALLFPVAIPTGTSLAIGSNEFNGMSTSSAIAFPALIDVSVNLSNNTFTGIAGDAIDFAGDILGSTVTFSGNQISGVTGDGVSFASGTSIGSGAAVKFLQNCFSGVNLSGIDIEADLVDTTLLIQNNSFTGVDSAVTVSGNLSQSTLSTIGNCVTGVQNSGLFVTGSTIQNSSLLYNGNSLQGIGANGIFFDSTTNLTNSSLLIEDNLFAAVVGTDVLIDASITNSTATIQGNKFTDFGVDGILFNGTLNATTTLISTNCFQNGGRNAIELAGTLSGGTFSVLGNAFNLIGNDVLLSSGTVVNSSLNFETNCLQGVNGGAFAFSGPVVNTPVTISCNQLDDIIGAGVSFCGDLDGLALKIANTSFADLNGPVIEICPSATANNIAFTVQDSSFTNIIGTGIEIDADLNNSSVKITTNVFNTLSDDAILFTGAIDSSSISITSNIFTGVADHAVAFTGALSGSDDISILSNCITNVTSGGTLSAMNSSGSALFFGNKIDAANIVIAGNSMTNVEVDGVTFAGLIGNASNITLQNNLLNLVGRTGFRFTGNVVNSTGVTIGFNVLENIGVDGTVFEGSKLDSSSVAFNVNSLTNIGGAGFAINSAIDSLTFSAAGNDLQTVRGDGFIFTNTTGTASNTIAFLNNNLFNVTGSGICFNGPIQQTSSFNNTYLSSIGEVGIVFNGPVLSGSSITLNSTQANGIGLQGIAFNGTITGHSTLVTETAILLDSNSIFNTGHEGILFGNDLLGFSQITLNANELSNIGTSSLFAGIAFQGDMTTFMGGFEYPQLMLTNNSIENTTGAGMLFHGLIDGAPGVGTYTSITANNNNLASIGRTGFSFDSTIKGHLSFTGNALNLMGDSGAFFNSDIFYPGTVMFTSNTVIGANMNGICFNGNLGPQVFLNFDGNFLQDLGGNGTCFAGAIECSPSQGVNINFSRNNYRGIAKDGIVFESTIGMDSAITGTGNSFINIAGNGIAHLMDVEGGSGALPADITAINYSCNTFMNVEQNGVIFKGFVGTNTALPATTTTRLCFNNNELANIGVRGFQLGSIDASTGTFQDLRQGFLYANSNSFNTSTSPLRADMMLLLGNSTADVELNSFTNRSQFCAREGTNCLKLTNNESTLPLNAYVIDVLSGVTLDVQPVAVDFSDFVLQANNLPVTGYMVNNLGTIDFVNCPRNSLDACAPCTGTSAFAPLHPCTSCTGE